MPDSSSLVPRRSPSFLHFFEQTYTNVARILGALRCAGDRRTYSLLGDSTPSCSCLGVSKLQLRTVSASSPLPSPHPLEVPLSLAGCILRSLGTNFLPKGIWRAPLQHPATACSEGANSRKTTKLGEKLALQVPSNPKGAGAEFRGPRRVLEEGEGSGAPRAPTGRFSLGARQSAVLPGHEGRGHVGGIELGQ